MKEDGLSFQTNLFLFSIIWRLVFDGFTGVDRTWLLGSRGRHLTILAGNIGYFLTHQQIGGSFLPLEKKTPD